MRLALFLVLAAGAGAKEIPNWIRDAARQPAATYPAKVTVEALLSEERLAVAPNGKRTMTERGVLRILQASKRALEAFRVYNTKSGRIRDFHAWLILPSGQESEYDKNKILDVPLAELFDEARAKMVQCEPNRPAATIFAYEVTEEEDTIFTTYQFDFQGSNPVALSRFILTLPAGWEVRGTLLNHPPLEPHVTDNSYTWEMRNLPWIEDQDFSPGFHSIAARLGVTYFPTAASNAALTPLKDWTAVSSWFAGFSEPSVTLTAAISAKANELTRGASTEVDKIRALARFVQQTSYVSVQMNLEHGGGYTPHPANEVLTRNYGDCKDKTTLLRALLRAVGLDSYAVSLYSGDRDFVHPEWPSPMQFNHAIVAVKLSSNVASPATVESPKLGRLLIFDPTDPYTSVGDLPEDEQGSYAVIVAPHDGGLVRVPQLPLAASRIELTVEGAMDGDGQTRAHIVSQYFGQSGAIWRVSAHENGDAVIRKALEAIFSRRIGGGITLDNVAVKENPERLDLSLDLAANHFAQSMNKLLVFRPGALAPEHGYNFPKVERQLPVRLFGRVRRDHVTLRLPQGYVVDELPDTVDMKGPYGSYHAIWKAADGVLTFEQSLEIQSITAPAADYAAVRDFFDHVSGGQYAPVVLTKP